MIAHTSNTGGVTLDLRNMELRDHARYEVESVTLDDVFRDRAIERCRLLKIDCEGSEYEILLNTSRLNQIEYLSSEFHINSRLAAQGYSTEDLARHCQATLLAGRARYTTCRIAE